MKIENLERGNQLQPLIANAKKNIEIWGKATSFTTNNIDAILSSGQEYTCLNIKYIPFDVAQALSLAGFRKELQRLEDEFNAL